VILHSKYCSIRSTAEHTGYCRTCTEVCQDAGRRWKYVARSKQILQKLCVEVIVVKMQYDGDTVRVCAEGTAVLLSGSYIYIYAKPASMYWSFHCTVVLVLKNELTAAQRVTRLYEYKQKSTPTLRVWKRKKTKYCILRCCSDLIVVTERVCTCVFIGLPIVTYCLKNSEQKSEKCYNSQDNFEIYKKNMIMNFMWYIDVSRF
jgi:hypothetical protein